LNTALELQSDLDLEPITLNGHGIAFNGHNTGALRNTSNNNTYTGVITLNSNSTIGVDTGSSLTVAAPGGIIDGANVFSLTKELTGTLILASSDNYDGGTFVNQGILNIQHGNALGLTAATTTVLDGAQLPIQGGIPVQNQLLHISGTGVFGTGALESVGGSNHWVGAVTLSKDPAFAPPTVAPNNVAIGVLDTGPNDRLTIDGVINQPL